MLLNDMSKDFDRLLYTERLSRNDVNRVFNLAQGNLSRLLHKPMPTPQLVSILEAMEYDIRIEYVKRARSRSNTVLEYQKEATGGGA